MDFAQYLNQEWVPALGCTEPASIALAAAKASEEVDGEITKIKLVTDPKIYKNCYAVGIPHSGHKTGIKWAVALGAYLNKSSKGLECFQSVSDKTIQKAETLILEDHIFIDVDPSKTELAIDCTVEKTCGSGRVIIAFDHTNIVRIEKDGKVMFDKGETHTSEKSKLRKEIASLSLEEMIAMASAIKDPERKKLNEGIKLNSRISEHGLNLFPQRFVKLAANDPLTTMSKLVCAGVYARMWGEDLPVMSLAGSGNKGIVVSVPLSLHGKDLKTPPSRIEEALALACLITSATTHYLGTLSAVCGCSNAAGIGLAAGLVHMEGGSIKELGLAVNNMVGNLSGMICDGAKIGCALKTMTSVDAAFRAASLAMSGIGIPASDGIVGDTGKDSLENLGRIATTGMLSTDKEILAIMQEKLAALQH